VADGLSLDVEPGLMARMHGAPFALVPGEDGRLHARRGAFPFAAAPSVGDRMDVELDASSVLHFQRVGSTPLPPLDGTWHCAELAADWVIKGDEVRAAGPLRHGPVWHAEALTPRQLRVHMPSVLFPAWADAVLSEDGQRLTVNGSRARGLSFVRS
jgi:hypothetical protein